MRGVSGNVMATFDVVAASIQEKEEEVLRASA